MSWWLRPYLLAWLLAVGLSLGCLVLLMLDHLVRGRWGDAIRPLLAAGARCLPVCSLAFIPIALWPEALYPWTDRTLMASVPDLQHKAWYLSEAGFAIRSAGALLSWSGFALWLTRSRERRRGVAAGGLVVIFLSATVAAVDWVASLEPHFSSSAFGLALLTGWINIALAAVIVIAVIRTPLRPSTAHDLGNLLLATLLLWAYIGFTQWLLVWSADLPEEVDWYLPRREYPWSIVVSIVVVVRLASGLIALLMRPIKRSPVALAIVAIALIVGYVLELYWYVYPSLATVAFGWLDVLLPLLVLVIWPILPLRAARELHDG
jgi:hypothetical protein